NRPRPPSGQAATISNLPESRRQHCGDTALRFLGGRRTQSYARVVPPRNHQNRRIQNKAMGISKDAEGYQRRIHQPQWVTNIDPLPALPPGYSAGAGDALLRAREELRNAISRDVTKVIFI
ncbi:hypothetical protein, partial [Acidithiobacillus ferridurans]